MKYTRKEIAKKSEETGGTEIRERNRFVMFFVTFFVVLFVGVALAGISFFIGAFTEIIGNSPEVKDLGDVRPDSVKSIIYAADGSVMQELVTSGSNREPIAFSDMPDHLVKAFVAIEDNRFYTHDGVDVKGILRAVFVGLTSGRLSEGASTITQQLIKNNVFGGGMETNLGDRFERKFQEQYLALRVDRELSKDTILQNYLNTLNLGTNCLGVQTAAKRYFGKEAKDLDLAEATVLAATTSSPARYNPITHPDNNQKRREIVLDNMVALGYITQEERNDALSEDVYNRVQTANENYTGVGKAFSYFTDTVFEQVVEALQEELEITNTQAYNMMYSGGLRIYSTEDPAIQAVMEEEVNRPENYIEMTAAGPVNYLEYSMSYRLGIQIANGEEYYYNENDVLNYFRENGQPDFNLTFTSEDGLLLAAESFRNYILTSVGGTVLTETLSAVLEPQTSAVLIEQETGYVRGIVGGRGDKNEIGSLTLNRAAQSTRQPGSTFKIISTYAPALDICNATLGTTYYDAYLDVGNKVIGNWWGDTYLGYSSIRAGVLLSMNVVAVKCMEQTVTEQMAYDYAKNFGISTLVEQDKTPVFTLGGLTYGTTNLEMTASYAAIANQGVYHRPVFWTKVTDQNGTVILQNEAATKTVIKPETAKLLTSALRSSVDNWDFFPKENLGSTNTVCQVPGMSIAGKSGTTTNANDLWFIGYSPYYTLGVWCGYDQAKVFGDSTGFQKFIWQKVMARIHNGKPDTGFDMSGLVEARICSKSGLLAKEGTCDSSDNPDCHVYTEYFTKETVPTEYCNRHVVYRICKDSGLPASEFCPKESVVEKVYFKIDPKDQGLTTADTPYELPESVSGNSCNIHLTEEDREKNTGEPETGDNEKKEPEKKDPERDAGN